MEAKSRHHELSRDDFMWHYLLQSFATMGGARGAEGLIKQPANYSRVGYELLKGMPPEERIPAISAVLLDAKVRWPRQKASYISACLNRIEKLGGLVRAKQILLGLPGREEKLRFLDAFEGIGPKYARNIMMDVYHEDFRDSIALDSRIRKITVKLRLSFTSYAEEEQFFLAVARDASLEGWELDRLMYNYLTEFLDLLASEAPN